MGLPSGTARVLALSATFAVIMTVWASPSVAGPIDPREFAARKDFAAGRYAESIDTFAQLFAETGDPVFLRNIARCYQKMQKPDEAISNFEEYLVKGNVSPIERAEIQSYVREMQALKQQRALIPPPLETTMGTSTSVPGGAGRGAGAAIGTRPPAIFPSPTVAASSGGTPGRAAESRRWKLAGIGTAAGGAALLATGIAFGMAARAAASDVSGPSGTWDPSRDSAGRRYETLQWIAYGVGATALMTGGLMYLYGGQLPPPSSTVRVEAALWPPALRMEARF